MTTMTEFRDLTGNEILATSGGARWTGAKSNSFIKQATVMKAEVEPLPTFESEPGKIVNDVVSFGTWLGGAIYDATH